MPGCPADREGPADAGEGARVHRPSCRAGPTGAGRSRADAVDAAVDAARAARAAGFMIAAIYARIGMIGTR